MDALKGKDYGKSRMRFPDFTLTPSGLQYKDMREGTGTEAQVGDSVTVDWDGYTIGYYGRPFKARNKSKGGAFTGEGKDFLRYTLGRDEVIPAFEEATQGMKEGGIRRIIVPVELGYPQNDMRKKEPKPTTFSVSLMRQFHHDSLSANRPAQSDASPPKPRASARLA